MHDADASFYSKSGIVPEAIFGAKDVKIPPVAEELRGLLTKIEQWPAECALTHAFDPRHGRRIALADSGLMHLAYRYLSCPQRGLGSSAGSYAL